MTNIIVTKHETQQVYFKSIKVRKFSQLKNVSLGPQCLDIYIVYLPARSTGVHGPFHQQLQVVFIKIGHLN